MKRPGMRELPLKVPHTDSDAAEQLCSRLYLHLEAVPADRRIVVVCIGTDRSTGDALGPIIGTYLHKYRRPSVRAVWHTGRACARHESGEHAYRDQ